MDNPLRLRISHTTRYDYEQPVSYSLQQLRLSPRSTRHQKVLQWNMTVDGGKPELEFDDHFGNHVALVSTDPGARIISISCEGEVEVTDNHGVVGAHRGFTPLWLYNRSTPLTAASDAIEQLVSSLAGSDEQQDISRLHALMALIGERVVYETDSSSSSTTAAQALAAGRGVCQDHTHIMLSAARVLGHPARYVSGYLMMDDRVDQDATHAWAEIHVDQIGWVGFDVSNRISPDQRYVRVATGLDYASAAPISGMRFGTGAESLSVDVQVQQ